MADEQPTPPEQKPPAKNDEAVKEFIEKGGREDAQKDFDAIIKRAAEQPEKND
jgi:hypothetical protein